MARSVLPHVHAEAVLVSLQEARPAGLFIGRLALATERTRSQIYTGVRQLRLVAAARDLPPVTWDRTWGYRLVDTPEVWIGYERAFFAAEHRRIHRLIQGILLAHQRKAPDDPFIPTVLAQLGAVESPDTAPC
ncbi:hypothetical protein [Streptomyces tsukubensis]|uniref:hypothetical protein n=1 Tax=Streptomyces tsukubensis TaxID=83656 RepID=UPI0034502E1B